MLEVLEPKQEFLEAGLGLSMVLEGLLEVGKSGRFVGGIFGTAIKKYVRNEFLRDNRN